MTIAIVPLTSATGTNDPSRQISRDVWNAGHRITGAATSGLAFDDSGTPVELLTDLTLEMFGGDGTGGAANDTAMLELLAFIAAEDRNRNGWVYRGARRILLPGREYGFDAGIELKSTVHLLGFSSGMAGGVSTKLVFPASSHGIRVNRHDTLGSGGPVASTTGADGSIIEGLYLEGGGGAASLFLSGIHMRARAEVYRCVILGFAGRGVLIWGDSGASDGTYGNANNWCVEKVRLQSNKQGGIYVRGGDANAGKGSLIDATTNGGYGIEDRSFLGNGWEYCHTDANGLGTSAGLATSVVTDGTWRYQLKDGQDANAASTAPTTGASNAVWLLHGAGGAAPWAGIPMWDDSEWAFVSGGSYFIGDADGNSRSLLKHCYAEGGQADPIIKPPAYVEGGFMAQGQPLTSLDGPALIGSHKGLLNHSGFGKSSLNRATGVQVEAGIGSNDEQTVWRGMHSVKHPLTWSTSFGYGGFVTEDLLTTYGGAIAYKVTGPQTLEQYGTGSIVPYVLHPVKLALDDAGGTFKIIKRCAAQADTTAADLAALKVDFNALLAKLRTSNLLAT